MKLILCTVLLAIFFLSCTSPATAQDLFEKPRVEYANDLSELRLRRVYVYSADPVLRQAVVKELRRERSLLDIVERAEDADYLIRYEGPMDEGADPFDAAAGMGRATATGTLTAYRLVESCDGVRTRVLFVTRKIKTVYGGIPLPLTALNRGGFAQSEFNPRPHSAKRVGTELAVRGGLFLLGKVFHNFLRANPVEGSLSISFSGTPEGMVVREFIEQVKKARKGPPPLYAGPVLMPGRVDFQEDGSAPSLMATAPSTAPSRGTPCQSSSLLPTRSDYGHDASSDVNPGNDVPPATSPAVRPRRVVRADSGAAPQ
jgi:hypothetical protein